MQDISDFWSGSCPVASPVRLTDQKLSELWAERYVVDANPGFPDRVEVRDIEVGEKSIPVDFVDQPADTPYLSSHAFFVREGAMRTAQFTHEIPEAIRMRPISLRAFNIAGEVTNADLVNGESIKALITPSAAV